MSYEEIIEEIPKAITGWSPDTLAWIRDNTDGNYPTSDTSFSDDCQTVTRMLVAKAYSQGREDMANETSTPVQTISDQDYGDPSKWYVLDKNGLKIYLGDQVKHTNWYGNAESETVIALGSNLVECNGFSADADQCTKFIPDSWERFEKDLIAVISARETGSVDYLPPIDFAQEFVRRAKKLPRE